MRIYGIHPQFGWYERWTHPGVRRRACRNACTFRLPGHQRPACTPRRGHLPFRQWHTARYRARAGEVG